MLIRLIESSVASGALLIVSRRHGYVSFRVALPGFDSDLHAVDCLVCQ